MKENFAAVLYFLLWAEEHDKNMMFGGHRISDVVDAYAGILGVDPQILRDLIQ